MSNKTPWTAHTTINIGTIQNMAIKYRVEYSVSPSLSSHQIIFEFTPNPVHHQNQRKQDGKDTLTRENS